MKLVPLESLFNDVDMSTEDIDMNESAQITTLPLQSGPAQEFVLLEESFFPASAAFSGSEGKWTRDIVKLNGSGSSHWTRASNPSLCV